MSGWRQRLDELSRDPGRIKHKITTACLLPDIPIEVLQRFALRCARSCIGESDDIRLHVALATGEEYLKGHSDQESLLRATEIAGGLILSEISDIESSIADAVTNALYTLIPPCDHLGAEVAAQSALTVRMHGEGTDEFVSPIELKGRLNRIREEQWSILLAEAARFTDETRSGG